MNSPLAATLLDWYDRHQRSLPWRGNPDPYAIWVSEVMLQQTRVETVLPYYERWMVRFPTLAALAEASMQDVLACWEGLGYYSRARNLHKAARQVVAQYDGRLPAGAADLRSLPGVGPYTAGAIASIAFGQDEVAVDGNVRRVFARLFDLDRPLSEPQTARKLRALVEENLPPGRAGAYNQALMDLGATVCTARSPACEECPLSERCLARRRGVQAERPVRRPRPVMPHHLVTAAVIRQNGRVLIARRPEDGLLGGLWEFPGGKVQAGESLTAGLRREIQEELGVEIFVDGDVGVYEHAYTHFRITLHAFNCRLSAGRPRPLEAAALRWVRPDELAGYPMGKVDRQISEDLARPAASDRTKGGG